ncbi:MAG TPA: HAMP domain-containing protein [Labilithrix sp.]|nr:HAMP domain-containing protein [Labilithrix sp.]
MASHARRKRSYLLDPHFQIKWTGYLVVVVVLVMASLGYVIARMAAHASDTASLAVKQAEKAYEESKSNNILTRRMMQLAGGDNPALQAVMDESLGEVDAQSEKNLAEVRRHQADITTNRDNLQRLLVVSGVSLVLLLAIMGITITNRIVGPVHKMKRLLRRVSTGRLVIEERLRKGDELEDLFDTFLQMTYSLRAMQAARLATLDSTLRQAEASSVPREVVEGIRALRAQMVLGIEPRRSSDSPPSTEAATAK